MDGASYASQARSGLFMVDVWEKPGNDHARGHPLSAHSLMKNQYILTHPTRFVHKSTGYYMFAGKPLKMAQGFEQHDERAAIKQIAFATS